MTKKNAAMLRTTTHADDSFAKDQVILGMDAGQFADWEAAGMVREATEEEVATAKAAAEADKAPSKTKARTAA